MKIPDQNGLSNKTTNVFSWLKNKTYQLNVQRKDSKSSSTTIKEI